MSKKVVLASVLGAMLLATSNIAYAQEEHHPSGDGQAPAVAGEDGAQSAQPGSPGMAGSGGMAMMNKGMMGKGMMAMMAKGMMGRMPMVVINVFPSGQMGMSMMGQGGMMGKGGQGGMMGQGGQGGMMGQGGQGGMMGQGGQGGMMAAAQADQPDLNLDVEGVRERLTAHLAQMTDAERTVGDVIEIDEDLASASVLDDTGAVAARIVINRHNGAMMRVK